MSTKERREREKTALRGAILNAAQEIAVREGWGAVSIRKIAERIEYSPPMVYEYFDDKEALLRAIKAEAFGRLLIEMQHDHQRARNTQEAIALIGQSYLDFAFANPALYRIMHGLDGVPFDTQVSHDPAQKPPEVLTVIGFVMNALQDWATEQGIRFESVENAFFMMWASMHGLIALYFAGAIPLTEIQVQTLVYAEIQAYLTAWRKTPP